MPISRVGDPDTNANPDDPARQHGGPSPSEARAVYGHVFEMLWRAVEYSQKKGEAVSASSGTTRKKTAVMSPPVSSK